MLFPQYNATSREFLGPVLAVYFVVDVFQLALDYFVDRPRRADYTGTATACIVFTKTGARNEGENQ